MKTDESTDIKKTLLMKFNFPNILILKIFILIGNLTSHVLINFYNIESGKFGQLIHFGQLIKHCIVCLKIMIN